ncbi:hypothetical protein HYPSUDRAFT_198929 [Hypholoma sublateritium FD-334 SS-4]|uniref:Uncharacterized protein n=1 Tax=Hypholoma sublateritium (strain FD-334 SS-4) TaxID=945553 RepID=A0A0D2PDT2_HYPSF|nr:hypothetical protein HYPSUDRAFT_198929 [Hypholoma sublateritium FD-334 SS-4]
MTTPMFILNPNGPLAQPYSPQTPVTPQVPVVRAFAPRNPVVELPNDIIWLICTEHLRNLDATIDYPTVKALYLAHPIFSKACRKILFRSITFNLRRHNILQRVAKFKELLTDEVACEVQVISIRDNSFTDAMQNNERRLPFPDGWESDEYSHLEMLDDMRYELVLCDEKDGPGYIFSKALQKLNRLRTVEINLFYQNVGWSSMSQMFQKALCNLIVPQFLTTLSLHGVKGLPRNILGRFKRLKTLSVVDCALDQDIHDDLVLHPKYAEKGKPPSDDRRLRSLTLRDISGEDVCSLLQLWKGSSENEDYVDMTHPEHVQVIFIDGFPRNMDIPRRVLNSASHSIQHLQLHTIGLGVTQFLPELIMSESEMIRDDVAHPDTWLNPEMLAQPSDIEQMTQLKKLELSVSFWHTGGENEELSWAFRLFKSAPSRSMREVVLKVKIGGFPDEDRWAVKQFTRAQKGGDGLIWQKWVDELRKDKWSKLERFSVHILAPRLAGDAAGPCHVANAVEMATECLSPAFEKGSCLLDIILEVY